MSNKKLKALLIRKNPVDVREIIDIACAEFKKMYGFHGNVTVVDFISRPYGCWVVIEVPNDVGKALKLGKDRIGGESE